MLAHSYLIGICSAVLKASIYGNFKVGYATHNGKQYPKVVVEDPNVLPASFKVFCDFCTRICLLRRQTISWACFIAVVFYVVFYVDVLAKKYIVPVFETPCYEFVKANMNAENVIRFLIQAKVHYEDKIVECCWEVID